MTPAAGQPARAPLGIDQLQLGLVTIAILAAGLYLLVHGSAYCAPFLLLGLIYAIILTRPPTVEAIRTGAALLIVFLIGWSIFDIVRHSYHYALADAAYALWLFTAVGVLTRRLSKRTVRLTYSSHVVVIAGLVLVALPWQADTAIVAAGVAAIGATLASAACRLSTRWSCSRWPLLMQDMPGARRAGFGRRPAARSRRPRRRAGSG